MASNDKSTERPKKSKERHPKVRTGCLTCKQRHVKCDEQRPAPCVRCTKGGYKCAGYVEPPKPWVFEYNKLSDEKDPVTFSSPATVRTSSAVETEFFEVDPSALSEVSKPATKAGRQWINVAQTVAQMRTLSRMTPSGPYKSLEEQRAFKHFIGVCVPIVSTYSDPSVWSLSIPQAAWSYPAIKHSVIAVALVNDTMAIGRRRPKYGHNNRALYHVNCAIKALTQHTPPTEIIITAGLLLHFLEFINNNAKMAYAHLMNAVKICEEFKGEVQKGEHVREDQAELILNHLDPTLQISLKFAEIMLKNNMDDEEVIDHWTPEAFELKESLVAATRPGTIDSFLSTVDARNNWGVAAVKLSRLRTIIRSHIECCATVYGPSQTPPVSTCEIEREYQTVLKVFDHCTRLQKPIHDEDDLVSCMLNVHDQVLRSILRDSIDLVNPIRSPDAIIHYDELLERALDLVYTGKVHERKDLTVELGVIPPLFYLSTQSRCNNQLRRRASACLRELLATRSEGSWTGYIAGRIAEAIIDLEDELNLDKTTILTIDHQLEAIDKSGQQFEFSAGITHQIEPKHLWLTYVIKTETSTQSTIESGSHDHFIGRSRRMRTHLPWTSNEIAALPKSTNILVREYGYQGYFADATDNLDQENASTIRPDRNSLPSS